MKRGEEQSGPSWGLERTKDCQVAGTQGVAIGRRSDEIVTVLDSRF